jgi:hypothetical protein
VASDTLYQQSEKIAKKMPGWIDKPWNAATDLIDKRGDLEKIGERDYRIPFDTIIGGRAGTYNPDMGDMGRGSGPKGNYLIGSYFPARLNFELSHLQLKATKDRSVSQKSVLKETMKNAVPEFMQYRDKWFHSDGTAVLATATAHSAGTGVSVYTLDTTFGVKRLRRGQYVTVYNNALTSALSSSTLYITALNTTARTITLSGIVPGAGATDKICFEGVSGASPAGYKGLYYWHSTATSGTTGGLNRADEPEIVVNHVDAAGGLTPQHMLLAYHRAADRRGEMADDMVGLASFAQHAAAIANILVIQTLDISKGVPNNLDRLPSNLRKRSFELGGIPIYIDRHQANDRIDLFPPKVWGRTQLDDMHFYEEAVGQAEGRRFFELRGGSGAPAAGVWFGLTNDEDFFCSNPGGAVVIDGLTLPSGY